MTKKTKIILIAAIVVILCIAWIYLTKKTQDGWIKQGDKVTINYEVKLKDGRIFESTNGETKDIVIWEDSAPGLDENIMWLHSWATASFSIPASAWYAKYYDPNKLQKIPVYTLQEAGILAEEGKSILLWTQMTTIRSIEWETATLDSNPLHTRQDLYYTVQIIWINQ